MNNCHKRVITPSYKLYRYLIRLPQIYLHIFLILFAFLLCFTDAHSQNISFTSCSSFPGDHRLNGVSFSINGYGYIGCGQLITAGYLTDEFWRYDPILNSWSQVASSPAELVGSSFFVINNLGYIVGGVRDSSGITSYTNATYEYNAITNNWNTKSPYPQTSISLGIGVELNGKGYVGSGRLVPNFSYSNLFYEFDPLANAWTQKANIPNPNEDQFAFANGNGIFLGGGYNPGGELCFQYNPLTDTWSAKNDFPYGRVMQVPNGSFMFVGAVPFTLSSNQYLLGGTSQYIFLGSNIHVFQYDGVNDAWSINYDWDENQPPYYSGYLCFPYMFNINGIPYFTMGYEPSNIYYNETFNISIISSLEEDISNWINVSSIVHDYLKINVHQNDGTIKMKLFNLNGEFLFEEPLSVGTNCIDLHMLNSAMYILNIYSKQQKPKSIKIMLLK